MKPGEAYREMSEKLEDDVLSTIISILSYPNGCWNKQVAELDQKLRISNELDARATRLGYYSK